jgi:hypothetical protein
VVGRQHPQFNLFSLFAILYGRLQVALALYADFWQKNCLLGYARVNQLKQEIANRLAWAIQLVQLAFPFGK